MLLDADLLRKELDSGFFEVGAVEHSHDHSKVAYSIDDQGSENYRVYIKDLRSGETVRTEVRLLGGVRWFCVDIGTLSKINNVTFGSLCCWTRLHSTMKYVGHGASILADSLLRNFDTFLAPRRFGRHMFNPSCVLHFSDHAFRQ